jgi:hypothetical protein
MGRQLDTQECQSVQHIGLLYVIRARKHRFTSDMEVFQSDRDLNPISVGFGQVFDVVDCWNNEWILDLVKKNDELMAQFFCQHICMLLREW